MGVCVFVCIFLRGRRGMVIYTYVVRSSGGRCCSCLSATDLDDPARDVGNTRRARVASGLVMDWPPPRSHHKQKSSENNLVCTVFSLDR